MSIYAKYHPLPRCILPDGFPATKIIPIPRPVLAEHIAKEQLQHTKDVIHTLLLRRPSLLILRDDKPSIYQSVADPAMFSHTSRERTPVVIDNPCSFPLLETQKEQREDSNIETVMNTELQQSLAGDKGLAVIADNYSTSPQSENDLSNSLGNSTESVEITESPRTTESVEIPDSPVDLQDREDGEDGEDREGGCQINELVNVVIPCFYC